MDSYEIKILHVGDQHNDTVAPSSRKDDYCNAIKEKFLEIKQIAHLKQVQAVTWSGDMINKKEGHRVPYHLTNWLIDYFSHFNAELPPGHNYIYNYVGLGNHDIQARAELWEKQPIASIVKHDDVIPMWVTPTPENPTGAVVQRLKDKDHKSSHVLLHGRVFSYDADKEGMRRPWYGIDMGTNPWGFHISLVHTELLPNGKKFIADFTTPAQIEAEVPPEERPSLYLCGHVHDNLGIFDGTDFRCVNFGAIARGSIDEYNLTRPVQVALVTITVKGDNDFSVKIDAIPLICAKPASEIFYLEELKKERIDRAQLIHLSELLNATNIQDAFSIVNTDEAVNLILKTQGVRPSVEKRVRDYIARAKQELDR